ncbi:MAG TPA: TMEM175 family protein [Flavobacterium sp.]|jgi:uncharacterized membrane protein
MRTTRLESFSDGIMAIIITIMVLEFKIPDNNSSLSSLKDLLPVFISYLLSFIYIGIYWNNHHHMLHTTKIVNSKILWANHHLLFWISLIPFSTGWMGTNDFEKPTLAVYGFVLLMASVSFYILQHFIVQSQGTDSELKKFLGKNLKAKLSPLFYLLAVVISFYSTWVSGFIYLFIAGMWIVPSRKIEEKSIQEIEEEDQDI